MDVRPFSWVLLVALALSGCLAAKQDTTGTTPSTPTAATRATTNTTATPTTGAATTSPTSDGTQGPDDGNDPPTAFLNVTMRGLRANVTLQGSDPDGDPLNWTLSFGDGNQTAGTELPANRTHLYAAPGLYNVTFTVSDGRLNATARFAANVTGSQPVTLTGSAEFPCPQCSQAGANTGAGYRTGQNGLDSYFTDLAPELAGRAFTLESTGGDPDVSFRDSCSGGGPVGDPFLNEGPESGTIPEGATCVLMWEFAEAGSSFTFSVA